MHPSLHCPRCGAIVDSQNTALCQRCGSPLSQDAPGRAGLLGVPLWVLALVSVGAALLVVSGAAYGLDLARSHTIGTKADGTPGRAETDLSAIAASWETATATSTETPAATRTVVAPAPAGLARTEEATTPDAPSPTASLTATIRATVTPDLATQILAAVHRYQEARAYSQLTGDTSRLSEALAGDALDRQVELVNGWHDDGCYWEITLDAPMLVSILELRSTRWVRVEVDKLETRLLYCGEELTSETRGDAYTTTYVVELVGDSWLVTGRE